jgi:CRP-like cAMP-binding protein
METTRLAAIPLFADLDEADLTTIAAAAVEVEAAQGETLATQGDLGHAMFAIESGTVEVSANGQRLATLGAGDVFGEVAVLAAGIRMATVVATSPIRLIGLLKRDVWAIGFASPPATAGARACPSHPAGTRSHRFGPRCAKPSSRRASTAAPFGRAGAAPSST